MLNFVLQAYFSGHFSFVAKFECDNKYFLHSHTLKGSFSLGLCAETCLLTVYWKAVLNNLVNGPQSPNSGKMAYDH